MVLAAAVVLGLLVGLVIGGLGGGGGVLTVPLLVYVLGQSAQDATTGGVIIVGIASAVGVAARLRGGAVDWRTGLAFGAVGIPTAYLGTLLNHHVSQPVLLLAFSGLTLVAAAAMLVDDHPSGGEDPPGGPGSAPRAPAGVGSAVAVRPVRPDVRAVVVKVVLSAAAVGFLSGFLGVGGGFLVVPALVLVLRMPITAAVGTSLLIIVLNALSSVASRLGGLDPDWRIIAPFTVAAALGTLLGKGVAGRLSGATLTRSFAVVLVLVGLFVGVHSLGAL
jgi:uncharacterized protein